MRISKRFAGILWIFLGLLAIMGGTFAYEAIKLSDYRTVTGRLIDVGWIDTGRQGHSKELTIRYRMRGKSHVLSTTLGLIDMANRFGDLQPGDEVPVAVNPKAPREAVLGSPTAGYRFAQFFGLLIIAYVGGIGVAVWQGKIPVWSA